MEIVVVAVLSGLFAAGAAVAVVVVLLRRGAEQAATAAGEQVRTALAAGSHELDLQGRSIDRQVDGVNRELVQLRQLVGSLQREKAERDGQILARLDETVRTTADLGQSTRALREVLASPKARGQWGERMAEDVLRLAGLQEGISYRKQTATPSGTIPDFTFPVGEGRVLHMDVKFPIANYQRHLAATTDDERAATLQQFVRDVRARVRELTVRDYADRETTVGFLLLFIPNESVHAFIHEHDPDLLEVALRANIVPCSPSTLFGVLAVVRQAHDNLVLEQTSVEILECLDGFGTQWEKLSTQIDKVGRSLGIAHGAFDELAGTRRRALQRQVDRVDDLRRRRGRGADDRLGLAEVTETGEVRRLRLDDVV
jgi:DNA recombination protein RmuC